jgi:hypothetical protein
VPFHTWLRNSPVPRSSLPGNASARKRRGKVNAADNSWSLCFFKAQPGCCLSTSSAGGDGKFDGGVNQNVLCKPANIKSCPIQESLQPRRKNLAIDLRRCQSNLAVNPCISWVWRKVVALQCNRLHRASRAGFGRCDPLTQILVLEDLPLASGGP